MPAGSSTTSTGAVPVPVSVMLNGFCVASLLARCSAAVRARRRRREPHRQRRAAARNDRRHRTRAHAEERRVRSIDGRAEPGQIRRARVPTVKVRLTVVPTSVVPTSRLPLCVRGVPAGSSTTSTGAVPVPVSVTLNGFCVASLLARCSVAVCGPLAVGANCTVSVVLPPGTTGAADSWSR